MSFGSSASPMMPSMACQTPLTVTKGCLPRTRPARMISALMHECAFALPPDPEPNPAHDIIVDGFPDLAAALGVAL